MTIPRVQRVGVIGTGALGRHHVRILNELEGADLVGVHDRDPEVAAAIAAEHGVEAVGDAKALLRLCEAVVIAVPTADHCELTCRALGLGRHVLVEKPMAPTLEEADRMLAAVGDRVLAVGHVEFYNPAVQVLLGEVKRPRFIEVERLSRFTPRSLDVDVLLDLMIHDLQIVQAFDPSAIEDVRAIGIDVLSPRVDIASARIELASGCAVNVTASRVSDQRVRRLRVFSHDAYHSLDYQKQSIKGFRLKRAADQARSIVPADLEVEPGEPLRLELEAFLRRCRGETGPLADGRMGRRALELALRVGAEAAATRAVHSRYES